MHAIRLRHPWQREWHVATPDLRVPAGPADVGASPQASYQRSFNRPSGLLPEQAVWLVVEPLSRPITPPVATAPWPQLVTIQSLKLNSVPLVWITADSQFRAQVAAQLEPFNRLEILCELSERAESPPELAQLMEVRLEIY